MEKIKDPIDELKKRIATHIKSGGTIYQPKRQLPYYDYLVNVKKRLSREHNKEYSVQDIYRMCGYDFDANYNDFLNSLSELNEIASADGYLDKNNNFKKLKPEVYSHLCIEAGKQNSCIYDYIVIMTDYRLKDAKINLDYEQAVIEMLKKAYPNGDTTGFRRKTPVLYEMVSHLQAYRYPSLSSTQLLKIYGFTNRKSKIRTKEINEQAVLHQLNKLFPNRIVDSDAIKNHHLYYKIISLSIDKNLRIGQWLEKNGFKYARSNLVDRLAQMKVDEHKRYNFLQKEKQKFFKNVDINKLTDKERYYKNIELLQHITSLDNVDAFIKETY